MIRNLGVDENQCKEHCDRNATSGCSPVVNDHKFHLCHDCQRDGCSTYPSIDECQLGCASYGK